MAQGCCILKFTQQYMISQAYRPVRILQDAYSQHLKNSVLRSLGVKACVICASMTAVKIGKMVNFRPSPKAKPCKSLIYRVSRVPKTGIEPALRCQNMILSLKNLDRLSIRAEIHGSFRMLTAHAFAYLRCLFWS